MTERKLSTKTITRTGKPEAQYDDHFPDPEGFNDAISEVGNQGSSETWPEDCEPGIENELEVDEDNTDLLPEREIIQHNLGI
jgi:hypothetical protein